MTPHSIASKCHHPTHIDFRFWEGVGMCLLLSLPIWGLIYWGVTALYAVVDRR
jgi:hypothetical protein